MEVKKEEWKAMIAVVEKRRCLAILQATAMPGLVRQKYSIFFQREVGGAMGV